MILVNFAKYPMGTIGYFQSTSPKSHEQSECVGALGIPVIRENAGKVADRVLMLAVRDAREVAG